MDAEPEAEVPLTGASMAEEALAEATAALLEAVRGRAPELVLRRLALDYDAAFEAWVDVCGFDLTRSSFDQRVAR